MEWMKKPWAPHATAVALFIALSSVYFLPAFQGYMLRQGDITQWFGMAKAIIDFRDFYGSEPLWTWSMFGGMPAYQISMVTYGNILIYFETLIRLVLDYPPLHFIVMMCSFYVLGLAMRIKPSLAAIGAIAFAFSSFFIISIEAGHNSKIHAISYMPAILAGFVLVFRKHYVAGGVLTALALSLQLGANHFQITYYTALLLTIFGIAEAFRLFKEKDLPHLGKSVGILAIAALLALGSNATRLLTTLEFSKSTIRGSSELSISAEGGSDMLSKKGGLDPDYITNWSLGLGETWSLVFPNAKGGATGRLANYDVAMREVSSQYKQYIAQNNAYWGDQPFTAGPVYVGALICLLFFLGLFTVKSYLKWPILAITALSIMLAWGRNLMWFTQLFIDYFPMYNKFRSVTMMLAVAELTIPLMAVLFLKELTTENGFWAENKKKIFTVSGVFVGMLIVFVVSPTGFFDFITAQESAQFQSQMNSNPQASSQITAVLGELENARVAMFKSDVMRSIGLMLLGLVLLFLYGIEKLKALHLALALIAITAFDLMSVDKRYLNNEKARSEYISWQKQEDSQFPFEARKVDLNILENEVARNPQLSQNISLNLEKAQKEKGKALTVKEQHSVMFGVLDSTTHYRVFDLATNTFNSASSSYFHKTVGGYNAAKLMRIQEMIEFHLNRSTGKINYAVLDMLNTKYIIFPGKEQDAQIQQNPNAAGNAWFVEEVKWVANADEEIKALDDFNPRKTAFVDKRFESLLTTQNFADNEEASIALTAQKLNRMEYTSKTTQASLALFSEMYYQPGWQAYIDGQPVEHFRANYILRALEIPAGEHEIVFEFRPSSYYTGEWIARISSFLILLVGLGALFMQYKASKEKESASQA